jgi:hypothetical protein
LCTARLNVRQRAVLHAPLTEALPESVYSQGQASARQDLALHPALVLLVQAQHLAWEHPVSAHPARVLQACVGPAKDLIVAAPRIGLVLDNT